MQSFPKALGNSGAIGLVLTLPFLIMEGVNRGRYLAAGEEFPIVLFFVIWLHGFGISLILLPILQGRRRRQEAVNLVPAQGNTILTDPRSAAMIGVFLVLSHATIALLDFLGWEPLRRLLNGPNPAVPYIPGQLIALGLISLPAAAGVIAAGPIVRAMRAGGSLFAHPIHLTIVVLVLSAFTIGFSEIIIDQWPCFLGVHNCD
jgi:hypothetical protein